MTDKTFEDRLFDAVIAKFFEPEMVSTTAFNMQTGQNEPVMAQMLSPAARVARDIFDAKYDKILTTVLERLDTNALVDALCEKVLAGFVKVLESKPGTHSYSHDPYKTDREALQKQVREIVAQELARRALAEMDEEASI